MAFDDQPRSSDDDLNTNDIALHFGHEEIIIRDRYETLSIANDVLIALFFLAGSIMFLWEETTSVASWMFIIGSAEFLLRPVIRLARRTHLKRFAPGGGRSDPQGDY